MEPIKTIHVCRVCLQEDTNLQSIDPSLFEFCTGISLTGRAYSSNICAECEKLLSDVNEFKKRCISNDRVINDLYYSTLSATEIKEELLETFADPLNAFTVKEELDEQEFAINDEIDVTIKPKKQRTKLEVKPNKKRLQLDEVTPEVSSAELPDDHDELDEEIFDEEIVNEAIVKSKKVRKKSTRRSKLCPLCGKMILCHNLNAHLRTHKEGPAIRYPCDLCDKTFTLKTNVEKHKQTVHAKEKRYACKICNEKFIQWATRRRHLANVHNAIEKTHVCNICGKKFLKKSLLEWHITVHTNEKPHKCEICFKNFRSRTHLSKHMNIHTKEKSFPCKICEKSFSATYNLKMHERIHTGFKDYVCPVCSKEFMQNHVMRSHCRSNHPEYVLPPAGTIMSQSYLKKLKEAEGASEVND